MNSAPTYPTPLYDSAMKQFPTQFAPLLLWQGLVKQLELENAALKAAAALASSPAGPGEREAFEAWLHDQHIDVPQIGNKGSYKAGEYVNTDIEDWWDAWQARARFKAPQQAAEPVAPKEQS